MKGLKHYFAHFPPLYLVQEMFPHKMECHRSDRSPPVAYITDYGRKVHLRGNLKKIKEFCIVKSNLPIPKICPFYYFEVKVEDLGLGGMIQIGITTAGNAIGTVIGQEKGYAIILAGDKTRFFLNDDQVSHFACVTGDTVGMAINFMDNNVFITKNGLKTECKFENIKIEEYYPAVMLNSGYSCLEVNFGQNPFVYDLSTDLNALILETSSLRESTYVEEPNNIRKQADTLDYIFDYMTVHGHSQTRAEIKKFLEPTTENSDEHIKLTSDIYEMIYSKDYNNVYNKIMDMFPDLESTYPSVYLALQCAKLYHQAFSIIEIREKLPESKDMDGPLEDLIKLVQAIEERISYLKPKYYELDNYTDDCQLSPYEWKRLSEELIGLLCLSDANRIEQFDRSYDFRKNIWFGVSKLLNGGNSSLLDDLPTKTFQNFEMGMINRYKEAVFGFIYALKLYRGEYTLKFT